MREKFTVINFSSFCEALPEIEVKTPKTAEEFEEAAKVLKREARKPRCFRRWAGDELRRDLQKENRL